MPEAHRHVTRRDGRLEGEPDVEPDAKASPRARAEKESQRDLTSLSGPPGRRAPNDDTEELSQADTHIL